VTRPRGEGSTGEGGRAGLGRAHLASTSALLLSATALLSLGGLRDLGREFAGSSPVCSGVARPPAFLSHVDSARVVFLTPAVDPLRSELYFCLQYELVPRLVARVSLAAPEAPLGFAPEADAVVWAAGESELDALRARLAAESPATGAAVRARDGGWAWIEAETE
jgi:hypothetical protein